MQTESEFLAEVVEATNVGWLKVLREARSLSCELDKMDETTLMICRTLFSVGFVDGAHWHENRKPPAGA